MPVEKPLAYTRRTAGGGESWNTELAVTEGLLYTAESLPKAGPDLHIDAGPDQEQRTRTFMGNINKNNGTTEHLARFLLNDEIMALILGSDTVSQPDIPNSPSAFDHSMALAFASARLNKWVTLALRDPDSPHGIGVFVSAKPVGFTMEYDQTTGDPVKITIEWIISRWLSGGASTVNTSTEFDAITYRTRVRAIMPHMGRFRINVESAGALGSGDILIVQKATVGWRSGDANNFGSQDGAATPQAQATFEPEQKDYGTPTLSITVSKRGTFTKDVSDKVATISQTVADTFKADFLLESPATETIGTGDTTPLPFRWLFEFASLVPTIDIAQQLTNPFLNEVTIPFQVQGAVSNPTGFSHSDHIRLTSRNGVATAFVD